MLIFSLLIIGIFFTKSYPAQSLEPSATQTTCPPITLLKGSTIYFQTLFGSKSVSYKMMFDRPLAEIFGPYTSSNTTTQDESSETQNYTKNTVAIILCPLGQFPSESLFSVCKNGEWTPSFGTCEPILPKLVGKFFTLFLGLLK